MSADDIAVQGDADPLVVDDINNHLAQAKEMDRAALLPGMYLAWCVRLKLVSESFVREHSEAVLRLNYGDCTGAEVLVSACGGSLRYEHLNETGAAFTRGYYSRYVSDWQTTFGDDRYGVEDSWASYQQIAAVLTFALRGAPATARPAGKGRWWQFWK